MKDTKILFSKAATARKLGISTDTLRDELASGKIKGHRRGKRIKFSQKQIDEYVEDQQVDGQNGGPVNFDDYEHVDRVPV